MSTPLPAAESAPTESALPESIRCGNCNAPLLGEHCYACGQPTKGLVRHFSSILGDFADTVFNVDGRIFRTLPALLAKPGYLSQEYFDGHRVRFVSPVRLFVFLSIITFLLAQWATPDFKVDGSDGLNIGFSDSDSNFRTAKTIADVEKQRDKAMAEFDRAAKEGADVPGLSTGMIAARDAVEKAAARRIAELEAAKAAPANAAKAPALPGPRDGEDAEFRFNGKPWHPTDNPLVWGWLPEAGNAQLNELVGRLKENRERIKQDPNLFKSAIFNALPTTLFLLVPVFALLLKIAYVFKRRLYMEHLIVALHSHAFLCLAVIVLIVMSRFEAWAGNPAWLSVPFGVIEMALAVWMPLYLLLMQKRIYRQGWPMTLIKYTVLGFTHFMLLTIGVSLTMIAAAIWL